MHEEKWDEATLSEEDKLTDDEEEQSDPENNIESGDNATENSNG